MISVGTTSRNLALNKNQAERQISETEATKMLTRQSINSLVLEAGEKLHTLLTSLRIPVTARKIDASGSLDADITDGNYNIIFIDHDLGDYQVSHVLKQCALLTPSISIVIIDGPTHLMNKGALDCVPSSELSSSRLDSLLMNANRFRKLLQQPSAESSNKNVSAFKDPLTSLYGRTKFKIKLAEVINNANGSDVPISLIILDIDSFKGLNESKGHEFGDLILKTVAERLVQFAPENSIVGRLGDDEFALLLHGAGLAKISDTTIAARLSHELRQPYFINNQSTTLSATMGIAKIGDQDSADTLLHKSMSALYTAKRDKNRFMVYTKQEDAERREQLKLAQQLPEGIDDGQLRLHYQPMIRMHDSTVTGVEALVRWQHPEKGLLFPDSFIPLAEGSGSVEPLTRWVLDAAIKQGGKWLTQGHRLSVSVNISALLLHNPIFPDIVNRLLEQSNFPAELLKLEITESAIISDVIRATDVVTRLHELGVKVSIDDFGTGYTSLAYIRKLPVDEIKIDKSFVLNMNTISDDAVIVRTLLELARNLDLSVVAEGVEDRETWYMLAGLGCHVAQGYYMSRPIDVEALDIWLKNSPWAKSR